LNNAWSDGAPLRSRQAWKIDVVRAAARRTILQTTDAVQGQP
jgi:hypothetical protein